MSRMPMEDIKVLEVGNIVAGPWGSTMLADFGAKVIKVEPPKGGDLMRGMGRIKDLWFCVDNRNKYCITLNLKSEKGREILSDLIKDCDVLFQNFRPGVFDRLGFSYEHLKELNPRIIYVTASGYGQNGPKAHKPGFDRMGLAEGGFLEVSGEKDGAPIKPGISVADFYTAMFGCIGALMALHNRDITGKGQHIDTCLTDSVLRLQESIIAEYSYDGAVRTRIGNGTTVTMPAGHFLTKDGRWFCISVTGDKLFNTWAERIGRADLIENPKYCNQQQRSIPENREEINAICAAWVKEHSIDDCLKILGDEIPCSKVFNAVDIVNEEQFKVRDMILDVPTEKFGVIKMQGIVPKLDENPGQVRWAGKPLGFFNDQIYKELGYSPEEISKLKDEGVI